MNILESMRRVGGRVFTHYGDGWYGDLGAMRSKLKTAQYAHCVLNTVLFRFPPSHHILHGVIKNLGLPTTRCSAQKYCVKWCSTVVKFAVSHINRSTGCFFTMAFA